MPQANMRLSDAIDEYLLHRKAAGLKPNTIRNDDCWLRQFLTHTGNIYVRSVGPIHVDTFFSQNTERWGQSSLNLITTVLRTFFRFCRSRKWLGKDEDPTEGYRTRKVPKVEMLRVPVTDFAQLMDTAEHPRNRMLIALGLFLFLRASEIRLLRIADIDLDLGEVAIQIPKSDSSDIMRINPQLDRELRRYLTWYTETHGPLNPEWLLIPAKNALCWKQDPETHRLVPDTASSHVKLRPTCMINNPERVVQEVLANCGYPTYWQGVHTLRRSGARAFYDELCDRVGDNSALEVVSSMLHHANLVITMTYLGITESRKRRDRAVMEAPMFSALEQQSNVTQLKAAGGISG
jgi:integrase